MEDKINAASLPSVAALAFLGDAVYSLHIRARAVNAGLIKSGDLHDAASRYVSAHAQAQAMRAIRPHLRPLEEDICRRAGNSTHLRHPHHATVADYRAATALEAVLGLLYYLGDRERLEELLAMTHIADGET